jgi:hypothetical protein
MRILTWTTGYYITINLLRFSHIVRRSDNEDTEVRRLGIIIQLTVEGYCKDKGCLSIISNGMTRQYTTMVQRGTTQHHAMIKRNDKALYNNQLDEAWDGTMGSNMPRIEDWSTCLYTTTVLLLLHPRSFAFCDVLACPVNPFYGLDDSESANITLSACVMVGLVIRLCWNFNLMRTRNTVRQSDL